MGDSASRAVSIDLLSVALFVHAAKDREN